MDTLAFEDKCRLAEEHLRKRLSTQCLGNMFDKKRLLEVKRVGIFNTVKRSLHRKLE